LGRNSENRNPENVFNGGGTTGGHMDKRRPQLDSARRIGLRSYPHESSDCSVDVSTGGEICWAEFRKSALGQCFQWQSDYQWSYGQREAAAGFSALNRSKLHVS